MDKLSVIRFENESVHIELQAVMPEGTVWRSAQRARHVLSEILVSQSCPLVRFQSTMTLLPSARSVSSWTSLAKPSRMGHHVYNLCVLLGCNLVLSREDDICTRLLGRLYILPHFARLLAIIVISSETLLAMGCCVSSATGCLFQCQKMADRFASSWLSKGYTVLAAGLHSHVTSSSRSCPRFVVPGLLRVFAGDV